MYYNVLIMKHFIFTQIFFLDLKTEKAEVQKKDTRKVQAKTKKYVLLFKLYIVHVVWNKNMNFIYNLV